MSKNKVWLVIAVILVAGVCLAGFLFFFRMYQHDVQALTDFSAAYHTFDSAMADFSTPVLASHPAPNDLESKADDALAGLQSKSSARISSIIKNDKLLMDVTPEIADLAAQELDALKAYRNAAAAQSPNLAALAKAFADLTDQRKTAYGRFLELAEIKN